jgi:tRNA(Ile)-lysidine synthase
VRTDVGHILASTEATIRRHAMLAGGETVLVAVSGGADSVSLLYVLVQLAPAWRLALRVVHVDHQLRPDSSRDGEFVRMVAARLGVPAEVAAVAVPPGDSLEAAARAARYRALEAYASHHGAHRIAVAHTADDQAETVLMRLLEGAGPRGLAGIPPVRGRIIRPLLAESRASLRALLVELGLEWIEDPSNQDRRFLRNRIRHELLPLLANSYNPAVVEALGRTGRLVGGAARALERMAAIELDRLGATAADELVLSLSEMRALPQEVAAEVLRLGAVRLGSRLPLRAWAHRGLRRVLARPAPRRPFSCGGVLIEVSAGLIRLATRPAHALAPREIPVPGRVVLPEVGLVLESVLTVDADCPIPQDAQHAVFDADVLARPLIVRGRRPGDRLRPFGGPGERRLKALLLEAGLPRWERGRVPLIQAGPELVWVGGLRRSAAAPVTPATRRVLRLGLAALAEPGARR